MKRKTSKNVIDKRLTLVAGHEFGEENVSIYKESGDKTLLYSSVHGKSEGAGPLQGVPVMDPYTPLEMLQQKRLAARRHKTTYCYDFPSVFQTALRDIWAVRTMNGEPGNKPAGKPSFLF